jgi:hypothetical protein
VCAEIQSDALDVCPPAKNPVTPAERMRRYRQSPAYAAIKQRDKDWRRSRKLAHHNEKNRAKHFTIDGRRTGPDNNSLPRLGEYWKGADGKRLNLPQKEKTA